MLKKIICTHGDGRFGNQLINYIHLAVLGLESPGIVLISGNWKNIFLLKMEEILLKMVSY